MNLFSTATVFCEQLFIQTFLATMRNKLACFVRLLVCGAGGFFWCVCHHKGELSFVRMVDAFQCCHCADVCCVSLQKASTSCGWISDLLSAGLFVREGLVHRTILSENRVLMASCDVVQREQRDHHL